MARQPSEGGAAQEEDLEPCLACLAFPLAYQPRVRTPNGQAWLNQELKWRTRVVRIFPNREACLHLVTTLCMEQSAEWLGGRRYLDMGALSPPGEEAAYTGCIVPGSACAGGAAGVRWAPLVAHATQPAADRRGPVLAALASAHPARRQPCAASSRSGPVRAVLTDPAYRANSQPVRDEIAALPGPEYVVALLEQLASDKRPLLATR